MRILPISRFGAVLIAALAVAACKGPLDRASLGDCPATAILEEPGELIRFKTGPDKGPTDIIFRTKLKTFSGICDFDAKDIDVELTIGVEAVRGPANSTGKAEFVYFVAVLDRDRKVLSRTGFPMIAIFERQDTRFDFAENVSVTIPRRKDDSTSDYIIYIGLEMTPEELANNRRRQRRR